MKPVRTSGFVLPYVLVVIAILAVAGTIAANRLQNTIGALSAINRAEMTSRMIDAAEADVIFALLGASTVNGGFDLNPNSIAKTEFGFLDDRGRLVDKRDANAIPKDIWPIKKGLRQVQTEDGPVIVTLQDLSGLPSLNNPRALYLDAALMSSGVRRESVSRLLTYLGDYIDGDDRKSFGGAERVDYTLVNMPPPSNSPIRSYGELGRIMGWAEALETIDMTRLKTLVTLNNSAPFRNSLMSDELKALPSVSRALRSETPAIGANSNSGDLFAAAGQTKTFPSRSVRVIFFAARGNGQWDKRIIELSRQTGHVKNPYRRLWVLQTTVLENDLEFDPAQMAELEHVIDPTSLRP